MIDYDGRVFRSVSNTPNGEIGPDTVIVMRQSGNIIRSDFVGGAILMGHYLGIVRADGTIDARYHQINTRGEISFGTAVSRPEILEDGRIRLVEEWTWTSGDGSSGSAVLEEIPQIL